jgi:cAMP-dependent protein kinase regulator
MSEKHQKNKERAARLAREGKLEAALEEYRQVVAEDSSELSCWERIAELSEQLGRKDDAVAALRRVVERLAADGFLFKAIGVCQRILAIDPSHTATQEMLASLYSARRSRPNGTATPETVKKRRREIDESPTPSIQSMIAQPQSLTTLPPSSLPRTPLFSSLSAGAFKDIVSELKMRRFGPNAEIIKEGEHGNSFFILCSGRVRVEKAQDGVPIVLAQLSEGSFFGEMALLQDTARTASVISEEFCEVLELTKELLEGIVSRHPSVAKALRDFYKQRLLRTATAVHPFFQPFTPPERQVIISRFRARAFEANEVVIKEGESGQGLFILLSGSLEVSTDRGGARQVLAVLGPGEMVGEVSLLKDMKTTATVRTTQESWVLRLAPTDFRAVAHSRPELLAMLERLADDRLDVNRSLREPHREEILV